MNQKEIACSNRATGKFKVEGYKSSTENITPTTRQKLHRDYYFAKEILNKCFANSPYLSPTEIGQVFSREVRYQLTNNRKKILRPCFKYREPEIDQAFQNSIRFCNWLSLFREEKANV